MISSRPTINWLERGSLAGSAGHLSDRIGARSIGYCQRSLSSKGESTIIPQLSGVRLMAGENKPLKCNKLHT